MKTYNQLRAADGGKDGTTLTKVRVRISSHRVDSMVMRCRPGTFEWRYGRNRQTVLFHAGSHFAQLWERAGATVASSIDFLRGTRSGFKGGIADGRVFAIDALAGAAEGIGRFSFERLIDYCVKGQTAAEIARVHSEKERDIAAILNADLKSCARHFGFT